MIAEFEQRITDTFQNYVKKDPKIGIPRNIDAIAKTEIRTTVNNTKKIFADELQKKNPDLKLRKMWIHNNSLSSEPRPGHVQLDKKIVDYDKPFHVKQYKKFKGKWIKIGVIEMEHPHDENGGASNNISCNCDWQILARRIK